MNTPHRFRTVLQRIRRERGLGRNLTMVAGLMVIALIVTSYILSKTGSGTFRMPWAARYTLYTEFDNSPAVTPGKGQEVRIAGVRVGSIDGASVTGDGKARLKLTLDPHQRIYRNATVLLRPKSPLNEMYVDIYPGDPSAPAVHSGETLAADRSVRPIQVDEVLGHLDVNARTALTALIRESDAALTNAPARLGPGLNGVDSVLRNLQPVVDELATRRQNLANLMSSVSDLASAVGGDGARLADLAVGLQETLGALGTKDDALKATLAQLPEFSDRLRQSMISAEALAGQLDPTLDGLKQATQTLPAALKKLREVSAKVDSTVDHLSPAVAAARPVLADLRPFMPQLNGALGPLEQISSLLDPTTYRLMPYLPDLAAALYDMQTAAGTKDANGRQIRGPVTITGSTLPIPLLRELLNPAPQRPQK